MTSKKAKKVAKHVSFASPLKQPSPKAKHQPSVTTAFPRLESFLCSIPSWSSSSSSSSAQPAKVSHGARFQNSNRQSQQQRGAQQGAATEGRDRSHILRQEDTWSEEKPANRAREAKDSHWPQIQGRDLDDVNGVKASQPTSQQQSTRACYRCLDPGHLVRVCKGRIRCKACFKVGHIARACITTKLLAKQVWRRKLVAPESSINSTDVVSRANVASSSFPERGSSPLPARGSSPSHTQPSSHMATRAETTPSSAQLHRSHHSPEPFASPHSNRSPLPAEQEEQEEAVVAVSARCATMANFAINPSRFIPQGLQLQDGCGARAA